VQITNFEVANTSYNQVIVQQTFIRNSKEKSIASSYSKFDNPLDISDLNQLTYFIIHKSLNCPISTVSYSHGSTKYEN